MILFVKYKLRRRVKTFTFVHVRVKTDNWKAPLKAVFHKAEFSARHAGNSIRHAASTDHIIGECIGGSVPVIFSSLILT